MKERRERVREERDAERHLMGLTFFLVVIKKGEIEYDKEILEVSSGNIRTFTITRFLEKGKEIGFQ